MITCRRLAELLLAYVERELPAEDSEEVQAHLASCPACVAYEQSYRRVIELGRRLPDVLPPPSLLRGLRRALLWGRRAPKGRDT